MATWKIVSLDRKTADGFVTTAHWTCSDVNGDFSGRVYGSIGFEGEPATPFADLTEATVIGWIHEAMGVKTVAAHEAAVAAQISQAKEPAVVVGTPW